MEVVARVFLLVTAWGAGITVANVQAGIAILSGVAILVYTVLNTYVLWRDRVRRRRD